LVFENIPIFLTLVPALFVWESEVDSFQKPKNLKLKTKTKTAFPKQSINYFYKFLFYFTENTQKASLCMCMQLASYWLVPNLLLQQGRAKLLSLNCSMCFLFIYL
jgi:hypothetical protein